MRIAPPGIGAHIQTASLVTENRLQAMRIAPPGIGAHIQTASLVTENRLQAMRITPPGIGPHISEYAQILFCYVSTPAYQSGFLPNKDFVSGQQ